MATTALPAHRSPPSFELRDVDFGLTAEAIPRDWVGNDAYLTTLLAALSLLFPEGERFFVDSVKRYKDAITDSKLRAEIGAFIGQEAMHGREHRALNDLLVAHGHPEAPALDRWIRDFLQLVRRSLPPTSRLAATVALEHFTAILAERVMADARMQAEIHASIRPLWLWHALEESEHKNVAFDVYQTVDGRDSHRHAIMLLATVIFFAVTAAYQARLLATRGLLHKPWRLVRGIARAWIYPAHFTRLVPAYFSYFVPGFHPGKRDTAAMLAHWRSTLFGEHGTLVAHQRRKAS